MLTGGRPVCLAKSDSVRPQGTEHRRFGIDARSVNTVAVKSAGLTGCSVTCAAVASVLPYTAPAGKPAPASRIVYACGQWSASCSSTRQSRSEFWPTTSRPTRTCFLPTCTAPAGSRPSSAFPPSRQRDLPGVAWAADSPFVERPAQSGLQVDDRAGPRRRERQRYLGFRSHEPGRRWHRHQH